MDPGDPTSIIFAKIRTLEPENAPKIIGYFLLQDMEQSDLIRIAFGPATLIQTFCRKAKSDLGLSSNGFSLNPSPRLINIQHQPLSQSSPRDEFFEFSRNPNPLSPSPSFTSTTLRDNPNFNSSPFGDGSSLFVSSSGDEQQMSNHFPFLNNDEDPFANLHKRSFSANDASLESEELGFGGGPGYHHRFPQGGLGDDFGSPSERDYYYVSLQREEMMRMKLAQQQRMVAAQFMAARGSPMSHIKGAGQFGEEGGYYYNPSRHEREDAVSKQIYLTFPSESSFTDEDVSDYFSNFGPVEDVRIPYQQERMYGFVTFAKAETVTTILARGNPHFICDWRVLVKPYKEKGKILQNKRQQQQLQQLMERGDYSPSSSPSGMDSRDLYDCRIGPRMFSNKTREMLRRKTEQADLLQAIELEFQRRRLLNLQLPDMENDSIHHHQRSPIGSPAHFPPRFNHSHLFQSEHNIEETNEGDSNRGEKHRQLVANSNEERGYSNDFYKAQETSLENTLPDSLFGSPKKSSETRQTEYDTEQNKKALSDQSA
ncbi:Zinc finger CCCH domain-containing protein 55 [Cardamine amara subsp. amara]|uniref:Zinc finger CCCH domain-containing protein 55 n=1 Tax=Cardamine amara subsp. amara TaxID=228776 RepID=A0ABD1BUP9_CARAN